MGKKRLQRRKERAEQQAAGCTAQAAEDCRPGQQLVDLPRALLAVHPSQDIFAAAAGTTVRVFSKGDGSQVSVPHAEHEAIIRALAFDRLGKYMLTAGDDKSVRVWDCQTWHAGKRLSAAAFSSDSRHVLCANKFGDVLVCAIPETSSQPAADQHEPGDGAVDEPHLLLGHFSSIVTSLTMSPDNRWLVSTDRERKVRVSMFPQKPLLGAFCIQSFCLGHTALVTCSAFVTVSGSLLLVTGSGDGTLRLWDPADGRQLDTLSTTPHTSWQPRQEQPNLDDAAGGKGEDTAEVPQMGDGQPVTDEVAAHMSRAAPSVSDTGAATADGSWNVQDQTIVAEDSSTTGPGPAADKLHDKVPSGDPPTSAQQFEAAAAEGMLLEEDEEEEDRQAITFEELPPIVLAVAASSDGSLLAAAVEGEDEVFLVGKSGRHLSLQGRLPIPGVLLPCTLAFDRHDNLWAAGSCAPELPLTLGAVSATWLRPNAVDAGPLTDLCTEGMRAALGASELAKVPGDLGGKQVLQVSQEWRKRTYSPAEHARRKRNRADLRAMAAAME